jgi:putative membrane protein
MSPLLSAIDYTIFPPINATLNGLSTVLLIAGFLLIKSGRRKAHQAVMIGALVSSALFLACYLTYHYGAGHTEFPKEYPVARKIYFAILIPHILLAVVNLPFIILLVIAAARGNFVKHKRLARFTFPSWLFVSITGVVIYFMIYQWFPPKEVTAADAPESIPPPKPLVSMSGLKEPRRSGAAGEALAMAESDSRHKVGDLVFRPYSQKVSADPGEKTLEVTFSVENTGSAPAGIATLESGCECLEVSIDVNPIPPLGKATITGIFDIEKLRGSAERKITVVPEGASRAIFLTTDIEIEPIYEIVESMTTWARGSTPETKTVTFRVLREKPVHVLSAESKRPEVACELVEVEKGRLYELRLTPTSTENSLLGIVRLETDCEVENYARPLAYYSIQ